ncbi:FkbM family methyltransferase [Ferruginibacter albus]|uniref:FkbM family methyltransferase n=1 Tax=Ferruginibacter albus TaxID=2875540 RepID=UPI001CC5BA00|nr:FkbM family methyltransferase [Ferruginibacter albus]UAY52036.1 FkbM family methyltransferase [Ferruginibacter albus]
MKRFIKALLPSNSSLFKFLSKTYRYSFKIWLPNKKTLIEILDQYANRNKAVTFIEIGANDGVTNDPLTEYIKKNKLWKGVLVEPVPYLFEKLKKNYASCQNELFFENSAISKFEGTQPFYRLKESDNPALPVWYDQIGSFNKDVILSHSNIPGFNELLIEEQINTITFDSLLSKYQLKDINLVHIDTEGYDFEILKLINWSKIKVDIVIYEYVHLAIGDFRKSLKLLKKNGFELFSDKLDIIGINKKISLFA